MDTGAHQLPQLFAQLGLPAGEADIRAFVAAHRLPAGAALPDAPFWKASQAAFLRQALACDAEWSEAADELAVLLSSR
ncbi:DUF2789 domain-containing protein [uncultured Aquitalea sp.]|uniref:DUF2789 domain-containing protein n=1 Tax=uncultured Aquitalea sp. TaxID=540272 RepID=UPI0025E316A7|nr:DUF2789 domain-containing protein [uncultured Aquitalea sp.]